MLYFNCEIKILRKELTMNYDIIKLLKIKYELIDETKSFEYYDNDETHIVELFLIDLTFEWYRINYPTEFARCTAKMKD